MTDPTCEERIASQLASREDDVRKMLAVQDGETRVCRHCGERITEETDEDGDDYWEHTDTQEITCVIPGETDHIVALGGPVAEPDEDYTEGSLYEFGLSLERKVTLKFLMSTGGPADWLEITCDVERHQQRGGNMRGDAPEWTTLEVERVTYHFADWFDHAEMAVESGTPLYELAEWVAEGQIDQ